MPTPSTFAELVQGLIDIISILVPVIFGLAFILLSWNVIKAWIFNSGDETSVAEGKQVALWGVIVLVLMFGLWGILQVLQISLGL